MTDDGDMTTGLRGDPLPFVLFVRDQGHPRRLLDTRSNGLMSGIAPDGNVEGHVFDLPSSSGRGDSMGMAASYDFYTGDMVRALNEAEPRHWPRYETVHGELLVSPAPRPWHQRVVTRLVLAFGSYFEREPVGELFASPADISWGLPDVLTQPDVFVVPMEESPDEQWSVVPICCSR